MKRVVFLLYLIPVLSFSQLELDTLQQDVYYSKVYKIKKPKKELHQKAQEWIAINFIDANEVIKLNTEDKIITKGNFSIDITGSGYSFTYPVKFIMAISFKENKYKLKMNSFNLVIEGRETPLAHHFKILNYDAFVDIYRKAKVNATKKYEIRFYDKILNNPEKLKKMYDEQKEASQKIISDATKIIEGLANDLYNSLNSKLETDW